MSSKEVGPAVSITVGPLGILFFIFLVLKLTGVISWSWFVVFLPLVILPAVLAVVVGVATLIAITSWGKKKLL